MSEHEFRLRISKWIRYVRISNRLSIAQAAARLNVRVVEWSLWETGNKLPDAYNYHLLITIFGYPPFMPDPSKVL